VLWKIAVGLKLPFHDLLGVPEQESAYFDREQSRNEATDRVTGPCSRSSGLAIQTIAAFLDLLPANGS
jgi:hypothetical protein